MRELLESLGYKFDENGNLIGDMYDLQVLEDGSYRMRNPYYVNENNYLANKYNIYLNPIEKKWMILEQERESFINGDGSASVINKSDIEKYDLVKLCNMMYYSTKSNCVEMGGKWILKRDAHLYKVCTRCGCIMSSSAYDDICGTCKSDMSGSICSYHTHKNSGLQVKFGAKDGETFKGYGLELEVEMGSNSNYSTSEVSSEVHKLLGDHAYFEHDGSLYNGFETITRPHTKEELFKLEWDKILETYIDMECKSHIGNHCGLHIHASREVFGDTKDEQDDNIAKLIFFTEYYWDDYVKFSRRSNPNRWSSRYFSEDVIIREDDIKNLTKSYQNRYHAINLNNKNTVEFRIARGTLKYTSFMATLDFTIKLAENASKISWEDVTNLDKWFDGMSDNTKEYLKYRNAFNGKTTNPRSKEEI